jgi:hypothetical protein
MAKNEVGQGYSGLGKQELNRRIKQHQALKDKAFASYTRGQKDYEQAMKLVGEFGSDPKKAKQVGAVQDWGISRGVDAYGQLQKASKLNKSLQKLKKNK